MLKGNKTLFVLLGITSAVFTIGVVKLFMLRFDTGDVYPAYSSLRSDPLGTKAFYESLKNLKPVLVSRNHRSLSKIGPGQEITVFYLGARVQELDFVSKDFLAVLDRFVAAGGRLVISFLPTKERPCTKKRPCTKRCCENPEATPFVSLRQHWGIGFGYDENFEDLKNADNTLVSHGDGLPQAISWHTALYFDELENPWRVIYACNGHPAIIERRFGRGTIVLCADSYCFSNEALLRERHPEFLAWLIGKNAAVVFDETHFGIQESPGIASLVRKYRLHWLFVGIVLLAGLFVWKNLVYFVPPRDNNPSTGGNDFTSERDYTEGLVSLLRRNISPRDILGVCLEEWKKACAPGKEVPDDKLQNVQAAVDAERSRPSKKGDPVQGYQTIYRILSEGNKSWKKTHNY